MSELLDKVNTQKETLKKHFWDSHKPPQAHEKVCDEKKQQCAVKMLLMEEGVDRAHVENSCHGYQ